MSTAQPQAQHMKRAREILERMKADGALADPEQALLVSLAVGVSQAQQLKSQPKGDRITLACATTICAKRDADGRLVISQIVGGCERQLLSIG